MIAAPPQSELLDDDREDEIRERLRDEVTLLGVARTATDALALDDGDVGVRHLRVLVKVVFVRRDFSGGRKLLYT